MKRAVIKVVEAVAVGLIVYLVTLLIDMGGRYRWGLAVLVALVALAVLLGLAARSREPESAAGDTSPNREPTEGSTGSRIKSGGNVRLSDIKAPGLAGDIASDIDAKGDVEIRKVNRSSDGMEN